MQFSPLLHCQLAPPHPLRLLQHFPAPPSSEPTLFPTLPPCNTSPSPLHCIALQVFGALLLTGGLTLGSPLLFTNGMVPPGGAAGGRTLLQARGWWSPAACAPTNRRCAPTPQASATRFSLFPLSLPALASPGEEVELWGLLGEILGWGMTCIYLTGRIPQILLNVTRGSVQGLSWPMFLMALGGNATYMGSILVRSCDWTRVKPNLPWLLDSAGCLLMDCLVSALQTHLHRDTLVGIIFMWGKGRM